MRALTFVWFTHVSVSYRGRLAGFYFLLLGELVLFEPTLSNVGTFPQQTLSIHQTLKVWNT